MSTGASDTARVYHRVCQREASDENRRYHTRGADGWVLIADETSTYFADGCGNWAHGVVFFSLGVADVPAQERLMNALVAATLLLGGITVWQVRAAAKLMHPERPEP